MNGFNPRARRGRDLLCFDASKFPGVSIHAPAGGATTLLSRQKRNAGFQSTRPQGARQLCLQIALLGIVSIHAPAGGATRKQCLDCVSTSVSIHAPAGGATSQPGRYNYRRGFQSTRPQGARLNVLIKTTHYGCFNPRARRGRDGGRGQDSGKDTCFNPRARRGRDCVNLFESFDHKVSIHAPAGGATLAVMRLMLSSKFQSTRPQGARLIIWSGIIGSVMFQSTRPQGARLCTLPVTCTWYRFNPRARRGRDCPTVISGISWF